MIRQPTISIRNFFLIFAHIFLTIGSTSFGNKCRCFDIRHIKRSQCLFFFLIDYRVGSIDIRKRIRVRVDAQDLSTGRAASTGYRKENRGTADRPTPHTSDTSRFQRLSQRFIRTVECSIKCELVGHRSVRRRTSTHCILQRPNSSKFYTYPERSTAVILTASLPATISCSGPSQ